MFQVDYQDASRIEKSTIGTNISIPLAVLSLNLPGALSFTTGRSSGCVTGWMEGTTRPAGTRYRAPMQWSTQAQAGFTNGTASPYIPVNTDYMIRNVEVRHSWNFNQGRAGIVSRKCKIVRMSWLVLLHCTFTMFRPRVHRKSQWWSQH